MHVVRDVRYRRFGKHEAGAAGFENAAIDPVAHQLGRVERVAAGAYRHPLGQVPLEMQEAAHELPAVRLGERLDVHPLGRILLAEHLQEVERFGRLDE